MKAVRIVILIALMAGFLSCKKKDYPDSEIATESTFHFRGTVDNAAVALDAGLKDYYMYTGYQIDSNQAYNFTGNLKETRCVSNCFNSLAFRIRLAKAPFTGSIVDSGIAVKSYAYASKILGYEVTFKSSYNKAAASYEWDFGDGSGSTLANPVHQYRSPGNYNVCLTVKGTNGCQGSICNLQKVGRPTACKTAISIDMVNGNSVYFKQSSSGEVPLTYLWEFGDGQRSTSPNPLHTYRVPGAYPVVLRVTDGKNNTAVASYNTLTQFDPSSCATNYDVVSEKPILLPSDVTVSWTDANGSVYSSENAVQPASSFFQVTAVENYDDNENGQHTKKLHVKFKCDVSNGSRSITIDNADAVISVAYE